MNNVGVLEGSLYDTDPEFWDDEEDKDWMCVRFDDGSETHIHVDGWWPEMKKKPGHAFSNFVGQRVVVNEDDDGALVARPKDFQISRSDLL